jgi:hypothetical protein
MKTELITITGNLISIILIIFIFNLILNKIINKKQINIDDSYLTIVLFKGMMYFSFSIVGFELFENLNTLNNIIYHENFELTFSIIDISKFHLMFIGIYLACTIFIYFISNFLFKLLFDSQDIFNSLKLNQIQPLISFSILFFILMLSVVKGVSLVCESLIPYPTLPIFR